MASLDQAGAGDPARAGPPSVRPRAVRCFQCKRFMTASTGDLHTVCFSCRTCLADGPCEVCRVWDTEAWDRDRRARGVSLARAVERRERRSGSAQVAPNTALAEPLMVDRRSGSREHGSPGTAAASGRSVQAVPVAGVRPPVRPSVPVAGVRPPVQTSGQVDGFHRRSQSPGPRRGRRPLSRSRSCTSFRSRSPRDHRRRRSSSFEDWRRHERSYSERVPWSRSPERAVGSPSYSPRSVSWRSEFGPGSEFMVGIQTQIQTWVKEAVSQQCSAGWGFPDGRSACSVRF